MGERAGRRGLALVALGVALVLGACTAGAPGRDPGTSTPTPAAVSRLPGPFRGLRWSGRAAPPGALLHDDGRRLWSIDLQGRRRLVWRHPPAYVATLGASPGGRRIALGVTLRDRFHADDRDPSGFLYVLEPDGSVRQVDVLDDGRTIESPTFLRAPTDPTGPLRLYWVRFSDVIADTGRLETQVMVDDGGPRRVAIPLRYAEGVIDLHGYPGAARFTLTLFRQNDVPTRFQILRNDDVSGGTDAALTLWGIVEARADTDSGVGVAWVSPTDYVIPVVHEFFPDDYALRRFRVGCEPFGSETVYRGTAIDLGYEETPWRILPAGPDRVLVLTGDDTLAIVEGRAEAIRWHTLELSTGHLAPTGVAWRPREGGWTWVAPRADPASESRCSAIRWTFP